MSLSDRIDLIDPRMIRPFHEEMVPEHTKKIAASMTRFGWKGRPLVVMELRNGTIKALTGSHRLRAARLAGLPEVPVIQLTDEERDAVVDSQYTHDWFSKDRQSLWGGGDPAGDCPLTEDIAEPLYDLRDSIALADLLKVEDLGIRAFNDKAIGRLRREGYPEEVLEIL
jgi:hypothetical protein